MYNNQDTIAAIATAAGEAGIAVVRMSGPDAIPIAESFFETRGDSPSRSGAPALLHGLFCAEGEAIDEIILLVMPRPKSYTREDVVEIQCHGGGVTSRRILRALISAGARPAQPGEFTMRAFLNGRMDLVQAEAVADLIHAQTNRAAAAALEQLSGGLSQKLESLYSHIMELAAQIEVELDFAEEDLDILEQSDMKDRLSQIKRITDKLIATYDEGRLLRNGTRVVISGRPNVGKSTLLNRLLDTERAIVSHIPGTTRDTIDEYISIDGFPVILTDTAGLRTTVCSIEEEGIRRTIQKIDRADIHIYLIDSTIGVTKEDLKYLKNNRREHTILIRNKIDLPDSKPVTYENTPVIDASLINDVGLSAIREAIRNIIEGNLEVEQAPHAAISERHFKALSTVTENIAGSLKIAEGQTPGWETLTAAALRDSAEAIGEVLGRTYHSDLLDNIFGNFCIGK